MNSKLLLGVVALLVVAGGGYYLLSNNSSQYNTPSYPSQNQTTAQPTTKPSSAMEASPSGAMMEAKSVTVSGNEFMFDPATLTLKKDQKVKLTFKNTGKYPHNFTVADLNVATKTIQPGQEDTIEFTPTKTGKFSYMCTVDSHADKGMKGTLTVQ